MPLADALRGLTDSLTALGNPYTLFTAPLFFVADPYATDLDPPSLAVHDWLAAYVKNMVYAGPYGQTIKDRLRRAAAAIA